MNNTKKTRTLAMFAVLTAATLVVGTFAITTTTTTAQSAFAYMMKKGPQDNNKGTRDNGNGNGNGNTVTIQKCKQAATESGWDNDQEQECQNLICTHPGENATCSQEGAAAATPTPAKLTCEQCFTKFLTASQLSQLTTGNTLAQICAIGFGGSVENLQVILIFLKVPEPVQAQLIQCLIDAGVLSRT